MWQSYSVDIVALAFFLLAWASYHQFVERAGSKKASLNHLMDEYRLIWMERMGARETRIVDAQILASLQNGTAFFASTSLLALGGAVAMLRATDDALRVFSDFPGGLTASRPFWEIKVIGLALIFGYTFFKFSWSYRLFNFSAILMGATPPADDPNEAERRLTIKRAAQMNVVAAGHFSRGQRGFFFALAYLGWFAGPFALITTTAAVVAVAWTRQIASDARSAVTMRLDDQ